MLNVKWKRQLILNAYKLELKIFAQQSEMQQIETRIIDGSVLFGLAAKLDLEFVSYCN